MKRGPSLLENHSREIRNEMQVPADCSHWYYIWCSTSCISHEILRVLNISVQLSKVCSKGTASSPLPSRYHIEDLGASPKGGVH